MKIVFIGGNGLIGKQVVATLQKQGHEAVAASPRSGVNTVTGEGLSTVLAGAQVVVDVSNSPSFDADEVMKFFDTSTRNLLAAEKAAGVTHHVALSVVGTDGLAESGYFRAKLVQEKLITGSPIPYSIVRATQFFEFLTAIGQAGVVDGVVRVPPAKIQPIASADVAAVVAEVAVAKPIDGIVDLGGPQVYRFDEIIPQALKAAGDGRPVVTDPKAGYFGTPLQDRSLIPADNARRGPTRYDDWAKR